jgi:small subunit ribosomal protein S3
VGQKVNPIGLRVGIIRTWDSKWFAEKGYADLLHEDLEIRKTIKGWLSHAGIGKIEIERYTSRVRVTIHAARPGIIIGRKGVEVERLKKYLADRTGKQVHINIKEIKDAESNAQLVAERVAQDLVRRVAFRRAMKKSQQTVMGAPGVQGFKIRCSGRLGGAEMCRTEGYRAGKVPLHTLRADIDYGFALAKTTYGIIGVKVWIYRGEIIGKQEFTEPDAEKAAEGTVKAAPVAAPPAPAPAASAPTASAGVEA